MEIINFKTQFEIGQTVYRVCQDGDITTETIRGVVFSNEPIRYLANGQFEEDELFATFDEAVVVAQPKWLAEQKRICFKKNFYSEL